MAVVRAAKAGANESAAGEDIAGVVESEYDPRCKDTDGERQHGYSKHWQVGDQ